MFPSSLDLELNAVAFHLTAPNEAGSGVVMVTPEPPRSDHVCFYVHLRGGCRSEVESVASLPEDDLIG